MSTYPDTRQSSVTVCHVVYALYAISIFTGLPALVGVIVAHLQSGPMAPGLTRSHLSWQIRSFWWSIVWTVIGFALIWVVVGWAILGLTWLWFVYRVARGWLRLIDDLPAY